MSLEYTTAAKMQAEIERLRDELWHEKALRGAWQEAASRARNGAIEECAKIADSYVTMSTFPRHRQLADAIRELKGKRHE